MYIVISLLLAFSASAVGVGPVFTNLGFEPNLEKAYSFKIYNTDKIDFTAQLSIEGELSQYITLESGTIQMSKDDDFKVAEFTLSLPRDMPPGDYNSKILVRAAANTQDMIGVAASVSHKLSLIVPKHGKYVSEQIKRQDGGLNITITNTGLKTIDNIRAVSTIYDDNFSTSVSESRSNLQSDQSFSFTTPLKDMGVYAHNLLVEYDELTKNTTEEVIIGNVSTSIDSLSITDFKLGEINQIDVNLSSGWNQPLKNIRTEAKVFKDSNELASLKSQDITLYKHTTIKLFLDTDGYDEGEYRFEISVFREENKLSEKDFHLQLKATDTEKKTTPYWIIIPAIIAILAIVILIIEKKRENKIKSKKIRKNRSG